ncbi:TIGR02444 family protein [Shewanella livingstonensis]|uniref:TIGR02444 family protein n=1 Tax=Shewanella livingstonensis TaxID=150120 RepID=A0A3G8LZN2_9GAMM|nr:TIGR02444 family protein [Shewanella livingstonensis]AZG74605.1 TIGR02444 family protein [Shewanella livingstonensis]
MSRPVNRQTFSHIIWRNCEQNYLVNPNFYIHLQDNYHVNVNILLLAQYLDQQLYTLTQQEWEILTEVVEQWEANVLQPYRRLRRIAKAYLDNDEYQKMLDVELIMERKSQYMLLHKLNLLNGKVVNTEVGDSSESANIQHYLGLFGLNKSIMAELT